jgi:two-component system phosphate regulon response regulator PhoB
VLIIDSSAETREVLRTALEGATTRILEANRADRGLQMVHEHHPDVVVLDLEVDGAGAESIAADFDAATQAQHTPVVVLGSVRRRQRRFESWQFVNKPYHYGPLIRKIEALLDGVYQAPLRRSA